ncbi:hypothetical protein J6590_098847 [Homalodisca vitripennis]|nr:hypothetical protein J6590_098847 [Homalodisca vitripennis]
MDNYYFYECTDLIKKPLVPYNSDLLHHHKRFYSSTVNNDYPKPSSGTPILLFHATIASHPNKVTKQQHCLYGGNRLASYHIL